MTTNASEPVAGSVEIYYLRWDEDIECARTLYRQFHTAERVEIPHHEFDIAYRRVGVVEQMTLLEIHTQLTDVGSEPNADTIEPPRTMTVGDIVAGDDGYWGLGLTGWEPVEIRDDDGPGPLGGGTIQP